MKQNQDKRRLRGKEDRALLARTATVLDRYVDLQLELAGLLTAIEAKRAWEPAGASSLGNWVARSGGDDHDAWRLHRIGTALEHHRGLEQKVRAQTVPLRSAEGLGRAVLARRKADQRARARAEAAMKRAAVESERAGRHATACDDSNGKAKPSKAASTPDADLLKQAETQPADAFRQAIDAEVESRSAGTARRERVQVHTSKDGVATFRRACELAKRALGKALTPGQAFDEINREYVSRHETNTKGLGTRKRKLGKTSDDPTNRKIAAEVKSAVFKRAGGDCCEFPSCKNRVFLQWAHGEETNADGGGQEVWNTLRLCSEHHTQFDKLVLMLAGWTKDGRPVFANRDGLAFMPGEHGRSRRALPGGEVTRLHPEDPRRDARRGSSGCRRRKQGSDPPGG